MEELKQDSSKQLKGRMYTEQNRKRTNYRRMNRFKINNALNRIRKTESLLCGKNPNQHLTRLVLKTPCIHLNSKVLAYHDVNTNEILSIADYLNIIKCFTITTEISNDKYTCLLDNTDAMMKK